MAVLPYDPADQASILSYAKHLEGLTFRDVILRYNISGKTPSQLELLYGNPNRKGGLGNLLEEAYFGYPPNSDPLADFRQVGLELKASPYELNKKGELRAGERLVLTMIPHDRPVESDLYASHLWEKVRSILLVYYLRDRSKPSPLDYEIGYVTIFVPPQIDMPIIEQDYTAIINKIQAGEAHLLSESDTLYLGACTKGSTAERSTLPQFYGDHTPARRRAFCLKNSYMTQMLNTYIGKGLPFERVISNTQVLRAQSFEDLILEKLVAFYGKSQELLCAMFDIDTRPKNLNELLLAKMLGVHGKINQVEEFQRANIIPKTISIQKNGHIKESMSFPAFEFSEIIEETWEDSELYNYLAPTKFLFAVFCEQDDGAYIFDRVLFWSIPLDDLEEVHRVWENTVETVRRGVVLTDTGVRVENDLPGQGDSPVSHVRPHTSFSYYRFADGTQKGSGTRAHGSKLPDGRWMTKQSFWFNNTYIRKQIEKQK